MEPSARQPRCFPNAHHQGLRLQLDQKLGVLALAEHEIVDGAHVRYSLDPNFLELEASPFLAARRESLPLAKRFCPSTRHQAWRQRGMASTTMYGKDRVLLLILGEINLASHLSAAERSCRCHLGFQRVCGLLRGKVLVCCDQVSDVVDEFRLVCRSSRLARAAWSGHGRGAFEDHALHFDHSILRSVRFSTKATSPTFSHSRIAPTNSRTSEAGPSWST